jgi:hypothetical protein
MNFLVEKSKCPSCCHLRNKGVPCDHEACSDGKICRKSSGRYLGIIAGALLRTGASGAIRGVLGGMVRRGAGKSTCLLK